MLTWGLSKNLENSLKYFLDTKIALHSVTDIDGNLIPVRVGRKEDDNWTLPCISVYVESKVASRLEIGTNNRDETHLIIIDIYASSEGGEGERLDLSDWLSSIINDGWIYYTYTVNVSTPESPTKADAGWASIDFLTNTRVNLGQNVSEFDQHRHRISVNAWIT